MKSLSNRLQEDKAKGLTRQEKMIRRLVAPAAVVVGAVALGGSVIADINHSRHVQAVLSVDPTQPHREVSLGSLGDTDGSPRTPDQPMRSLWDIANAAKIPEVDPADIVTMLVAQVPNGQKMGELQVGQKFILPGSAQVGSEVIPGDQQGR